MTNNLLIATIILSVLTLFFALWAISSNRVKSELAAQLHEAKREASEISSQFQAIEQELSKMKDFQETIEKAEVTTKLQSTRLDTYSGVANTPEKYQYIASLTQQGLEADEIATILQISPHEAQQLVSLAKLANKANPQL